MYKRRFATKILKRPIKTTEELLRIVKLCHKTTSFRSDDFTRVLSRALHLCYEQNYLPEEAFELGLFDLKLPDEEFSNYISKRSLTKLQKALNPVSWASLLRDKGIFYRYCEAAGVAMPKLYAIFFRTMAGWAPAGSVPASRTDWERFIKTQLPPEFVIKPCCGAFGESVNIFGRTEDGFVDVSGRNYNAADIYETMVSDAKYDSFVIQQRLKNHPELVRFTGTDALQTIRIITSSDASGRCRILHARLKLILGGAVVDNWQHGLSGNAKADICLGDGRLRPAILMDTKNSQIKTIEFHPKTGAALEQFRMPLWPETCRFVEETAKLLLPVRALGWDVAVTPDGPAVLETNFWWELPNEIPRTRIVCEALRHDVQLSEKRETHTLNTRCKAQKTKQKNKFFEPVKRFEHQVRDFFRIVRFCRIATPIYSSDYLKVFCRALRLWRKEKFSPKETFQFGLFKPDLSNTELSKCASTAKMTKILLSINPVSWQPLVRNKSIFYRYCTTLGVPVPKLYAIFFKTNAGWSYNGSALAGRDDWENFFNLRLPSEFVIKPSDAFLGRRVNAFTRTDRGFADSSGKQYTAADIYDDLFSDPKYDSFIIQEHLKNHPELIRLSDTQSLQTIRIITYVDTSGCCHIIHANLKLILGQAVVDNWQRGLTGNATALASLSDGLLLGPAVAVTQNGSGLRTIPTHPKTGIPFDQFRLPFWSDVCSLVKDTALKFLPVRTIGWDVALTPDGPVILEGNMWWSAPNQHRRMDIILEALSK